MQKLRLSNYHRFVKNFMEPKYQYIRVQGVNNGRKSKTFHRNITWFSNRDTCIGRQIDNSKVTILL